jgi:hypothetical protein
MIVTFRALFNKRSLDFKLLLFFIKFILIFEDIEFHISLEIYYVFCFD